MSEPGPDPAISRGVLAIDESRLEWRLVQPDRGGHGHDDRPTLVLLHEGLGCCALWRTFPSALAKRTGLAAFAYSRAGYGRSSPGERPLPLHYHRIEALAVLPKVLAAAGIARPVLIGHSDGGTIALIYADAAALKPLAVVTMAAHVFNEEVTLRGIEAAREAFAGTDLRQRLSVYHGDNVDGAFWGWCDAWLSPPFRDWNVEDVLPAILCPVLAIQGADDHYGTAAQVEAIAGQVSGPGQRLILPQCGHAPHLEQPEKTCAAIADFLAAHDII